MLVCLQEARPPSCLAGMQVLHSLLRSKAPDYVGPAAISPQVLKDNCNLTGCLKFVLLIKNI